MVAECFKERDKLNWLDNWLQLFFFKKNPFILILKLLREKK